MVDVMDRCVEGVVCVAEEAVVEEPVTQAQIKKIYALLHRIGKDPQKFKEEKNITNFAKLTKKQASELIDELEREEFEKIEAEVLKDVRKEVEAAKVVEGEQAAVKEDEVSRAAALMRRCVSEASQIVNEEMLFVVSEAVKAKAIVSIAATMFIQLMSGEKKI